MSASTQTPTNVLAHYLDVADTLEAWIKRVRAEAFQRAMSGEHFPGRKIVQKRATRSWPERNKLDAEFGKLAQVLDALQKSGISADVLWESAPRSPAQLQKALGKADWTKLVPFVISKSSGVDLVPDTDPRGPVPPPAVADFQGDDANQT